MELCQGWAGQSRAEQQKAGVIGLTHGLDCLAACEWHHRGEECRRERSEAWAAATESSTRMTRVQGLMGLPATVHVHDVISGGTDSSDGVHQKHLVLIRSGSPRATLLASCCRHLPRSRTKHGVHGSARRVQRHRG